MSQLAAAYAYGICKNHPFVDGNKRTSLVVAELFLALNEHALTAKQISNASWFEQKLAAGEMDEQGLSQWFARSILRHVDICSGPRGFSRIVL